MAPFRCRCPSCKYRWKGFYRILEAKQRQQRQQEQRKNKKMIISCRFAQKVWAAVRRATITTQTQMETESGRRTHSTATTAARCCGSSKQTKTEKRNGKMLSCARDENFLNNNNASVHRAATVSKWQPRRRRRRRRRSSSSYFLWRTHNITSFEMFFFSVSPRFCTIILTLPFAKHAEQSLAHHHPNAELDTNMSMYGITVYDVRYVCMLRCAPRAHIKQKEKKPKQTRADETRKREKNGRQTY